MCEVLFILIKSSLDYLLILLFSEWEVGVFFRFSYSNVCMTLESDLLVLGGYEERVDYLCGLFGVIATQVVAWNGLLVWLYACST